MPKLTIGMAHYDDFPGLWPTLQTLRLFHAEAMADCELLVVDNRPDSPHGTLARDFVAGWVKGDVGAARYIAAPDVVGTAAPRDLVFREARGDAVLCLDCHVLVAPGAIRRLIDYYDANPDTTDLLSGPLLYDDLNNVSTHFDDVWRAEMWGVWGTDPRGVDPAGAPFEIPAMGLGLFSCRKAAWPGFNPRFRGFGGEEFYLHEKIRQRGGRCLCLPFLRWMHRFGRPGGVPYPLTRWHKVRNYVLGHLELGLPLDRVKEHFVDAGLMPTAEWDALIANPENPEPPAPVTKVEEPCNTCGQGRGKTQAVPPEPATLEELYDLAAKTPSDIHEHCPQLREFAAQCAHVTEFGLRHGVSTVALLAGQPGRLVSYDLNEDPIATLLTRLRGNTDFEFRQGDSRSVEIEETDLLFIDTQHTAEQLTAELGRHAAKVRRWIVLHDTQTFGERGEDGGPGLLPALRRFLREQPHWSVISHVTNNHGLTVLSRDERDKPRLPGTLTMASNFAQAVAKHVADGATKVDAATLERRLEICTLCDHRRDDRCTVCGCFLAEKAAWRTSECPLGKWAGSEIAIAGRRLTSEFVLRKAAPMLVSCLCPTYGRPPHYEHLLEETIESFRRQDWPEKELIVLNDAPGQELVCDLPGVRVINVPERFPSLGEKLNAMIELAKGDLLCPWDDDDISLPWRLSLSVGKLGDADYWNPQAYWFLDRDPQDEGPATICACKSITLRAVPKPAGANFPEGSPKWEITEKPDGSEIVDPADGSVTAEISPDLPGTYKITASCGTSGKTFTLNAVKVTFEPDPVVTGFSIPRNLMDIREPVVTATVVPAEFAEEIDLRVAVPTRVQILKTTVDAEAGTIMFEVTGKSATPEENPQGDTKIEAVLDGQVCAEVPAIVVIPKYIEEPFPQFQEDEETGEVEFGTVQGQNVALNKDTSPALVDVARNQVRLVTMYVSWLPITIQNQFRNQHFEEEFNELYETSPVIEAIKGFGRGFVINQNLDANGTYQDPVGVFTPGPKVAKSSPAAQQWPNNPNKFAMQPYNEPQKITVKVGGHVIEPKIDRQVTAVPPGQLKIIWPTP